MTVGDRSRPVGASHDPRDRWRSWVRALLVYVFVVACVTSAVVGARTYVDGLESEHAARRGHSTVARVTDVLPAAHTPEGVPTSSRAWLTWWDRSGRAHQQVLRIRPSQARVGERVPVWVDQEGHVSTAPQTHARTVSNAVLVGVAFVLAAGACLALFDQLAGAAFDRGRRRELDREWAAVEPQWRRQLL